MCGIFFYNLLILLRRLMGRLGPVGGHNRAQDDSHSSPAETQMTRSGDEGTTERKTPTASSIAAALCSLRRPLLLYLSMSHWAFETASKLLALARSIAPPTFRVYRRSPRLPPIPEVAIRFLCQPKWRLSDLRVSHSRIPSNLTCGIAPPTRPPQLPSSRNEPNSLGSK